MADLSNIFGGPWSPPKEIKPEPPEVQLAEAMRKADLNPPANLVFDGKLHRFNSGTKGKAGHDKPGWYCVFPDGVPAGRFGCWRAGVEVTFVANIGRDLTDAERMANARRLAEARAIRDAETRRSREVAAETVSTIWSSGMAASPDHPYLVRKGIAPSGSRVTGDGRLMVPLYTPENDLSSLQYIDADGGKLYHSGGQTGGCSWVIGSTDEAGVLYLAEGFATAATIHEVTGRPCFVAYSASNLVPVAGSMREKYGASQEIVIVADNDASGTGQKYADQASAKYGARVVMPPILGDANDYVAQGGDLKILLQPMNKDWLIDANEFSDQPAPPRWIIKGWIEQDTLMMVHGPSGAGKSFVVLDWCLHIATGLEQWHGKAIKKSGPVVYLAGEGHYGMRRRVAAWKHHYKAGKFKMWLSKGGCDLNTPEGYLRVVENIKALPEVPIVIVIDTLHRFLAGDENSAQDAKTMIDACDALRREFGCTVVLVHHTGVSEEAQHRARGSSSWKAALEVEYNILPAKKGEPLKIANKKMKDGEPDHSLYMDMVEVVIPNWFDEDGDPVKSVVVVPGEAPPERKKASKYEDLRQIFEAAWWDSGAEHKNGKPYLSRSALMSWLIQKEVAKTEQSASQMCKPSQTTRLIGMLTVNGIVEPFEHGWVVICENHGPSMMMRKNA